MFDSPMFTGTQSTFEAFEKECLEKAKSSYLNKLDVFPPRLFLAGITPKVCPVHGPTQFIANLLEEEFVSMDVEARRAYMFKVGKEISEQGVYGLHHALLQKVQFKGRPNDSLILYISDAGKRWPDKCYVAELPEDPKEDFEFHLTLLKIKTYFKPLMAGLMTHTKPAYMAIILEYFSKQWDEKVKEYSDADE